MVKAILDRRKTQTRRTVKPEPEKMPGTEILPVPLNLFQSQTDELLKKGLSVLRVDGSAKGYAFPKQEIYPGDVIWVRERWAPIINDEGENIGYFHSTDNVSWRVVKWKPSIHMPLNAARLFLLVSNVRAERLQDISEQDAIAEGVLPVEGGYYKNYLELKDPRSACLTAKESFYTLWESINGEGSVDKNPFVWVYDFEEIMKAEAEIRFLERFMP